MSSLVVGNKCFTATDEQREAFTGNCTECGLCCVYYASSSCKIPAPEGSGTSIDKKLIQIGPQLPVIGNRYMRVVKDPYWKGHKRCVALKGKPRESVSCSIYDNRPFTCRIFEPGSDACLTIREWGGIES